MAHLYSSPYQGHLVCHSDTTSSFHSTLSPSLSIYLLSGDTGLLVVSAEKSFMVMASTPIEKDGWLQAIRLAMRDLSAASSARDEALQAPGMSGYNDENVNTQVRGTWGVRRTGSRWEVRRRERRRGRWRRSRLGKPTLGGSFLDPHVRPAFGAGRAERQAGRLAGRRSCDLCRVAHAWCVRHSLHLSGVGRWSGFEAFLFRPTRDESPSAFDRALFAPKPSFDSARNNHHHRRRHPPPTPQLQPPPLGPCGSPPTRPAAATTRATAPVSPAPAAAVAAAAAATAGPPSTRSSGWWISASRGRGPPAAA